MKVELIYFTGHGFLDPYYAARLLAYVKNTRLEQSPDTLAKFISMPKEELEKELNEIANTIRSSWEFVDYTFQITGVTRGFTHQFVRSRHASFAQQTQRVVDFSDFKCEMPKSVSEAGDMAIAAYQDAVTQAKVSYRAMKACGVPMQDCRGILPTDAQTNIIAKFNLRSLADLLGKRKSLRTQGEYGKVALAMEEAVLTVHPWAERFLNPERLQTPALDQLFKNLIGNSAAAENKLFNDALKEIERLKGTWG